MPETKGYIQLNYNNDSELVGFECWHKYKGEWIFIEQKYVNKEIEYFTNDRKMK